MENKKYIASVIEDPVTKDCILQFDPLFLEDLDWRIGDVIDISDSDGSLVMINRTLEERKEDKIFIVETISQFKIRYAVRGKSLEHAMDTVTCEEAEEMDQKFIGETIFGGHEVTQEQFLVEQAVENEYLKNWSKEKKLSMIHKIDYQD